MRLPPWLALLCCGCSSNPTVLIGQAPTEQEASVSAPLVAATVRARTALPTGAALDGSVGEWRELSAELGGATQKARFWLAITPDEVRVAVEATSPIEELRLSIALPEAKAPPVAFANQFGLQEVSSDEICAELVGEFEQDAVPQCHEWRKAALQYRSDLPQRFRRTLVLSPSGASVLGAGRVEPASGRVVAKGGSLEASLPLEALPLAAQFPLASGRIAVELRAGGHRLLSAPEIRVTDPSSFGDLVLDAPVAFGPSALLLARAISASEESGEVSCFVQPSSKASRATCLVNRAEGYQFVPSHPSPAEASLDVALAEVVSKVGSSTLWRTPFRVDPVRDAWALALQEGDELTWTREIGASKVVASGPEEAGTRLLLAEEGTTNPLGAGACGACPTLHVSWVRLGANLHLVGEGDLETFYSSSGEDVGLTPGATESRFTVELEDDGAGSGERRSVYRWSAANKTFILDEPPPKPEKKVGKSKQPKPKGPVAKPPKPPKPGGAKK